MVLPGAEALEAEGLKIAKTTGTLKFTRDARTQMETQTQQTLCSSTAWKKAQTQHRL